MDSWFQDVSPSRRGGEGLSESHTMAAKSRVKIACVLALLLSVYSM